MLLARHRLIDLRLANAIDAGEISQIVEVACGLSPRGWRFRSTYGDAITYVEADLPGMLENKQRIIAQLGGETAHHYTAEIDALADTGPTSIARVCADARSHARHRDHHRGSHQLLRSQRPCSRCGGASAHALATFPRSLYLSDLVLRGDNRGPIVTGFSWLLAAFVRGKTHLHFDDDRRSRSARSSPPAFDGVLLDPRDFSYELPDLEQAGAGRVRIIEAMAKP